MSCAQGGTKVSQHVGGMGWKRAIPGFTHLDGRQLSTSLSFRARELQRIGGEIARRGETRRDETKRSKSCVYTVVVRLSSVGMNWTGDAVSARTIFWLFVATGGAKIAGQ